MEYESLLARFVNMSKDILGGELVGIYLHGSAAMGCFNEQKSDLDLIVVSENSLSAETKSAFMRMVVNLNDEAPAKGLELSIVRREFCKPFAYPTPFELHFSAAHLQWYRDDPEDYIARMNGTDKDLAAHFTIIRHSGKVLYGKPIDDVFGEVPAEHYIDSIRYDIENAREDILTDPMYITLNLCRVLAYMSDGLILSKKTGGEWGIRYLPERFSGLIASALSCYETQSIMEPDTGTADEFAQYMLAQIEKASAK